MLHSGQILKNPPFGEGHIRGMQLLLKQKYWNIPKRDTLGTTLIFDYLIQSPQQTWIVIVTAITN